MPHQCLSCNRVFDNTTDAIIKGCPDCGNKLFLYVKNMPKEEKQIEISKEKKDLILKEIEGVMDEIKDSDAPIILKLENIRILEPGKYEIDINQLLKKEKPIIYKVQEGTYVIDLDYVLEQHKNER